MNKQTNKYLGGRSKFPVVERLNKGLTTAWSPTFKYTAGSGLNCGGGKYSSSPQDLMLPMIRGLELVVAMANGTPRLCPTRQADRPL
eukprot:3300609-Pyramimonas_sp.AAC.2